MFYVALIFAVAITGGLILLLLFVIEQQQPGVKTNKHLPLIQRSPKRRPLAASVLLQGNTSARSGGGVCRNLAPKRKSRSPQKLTPLQSQTQRTGKRNALTHQTTSRQKSKNPSSERLEDARKIVKAYRATQEERKRAEEDAPTPSSPLPLPQSTQPSEGSEPKVSESSPLSFQERARLRSQAQRTGKKLSSSPPQSELPTPFSSTSVPTPPPVASEPVFVDPPVTSAPELKPPAELEPTTLPSVIPDFFPPPPHLPVERKRRKPTQFYPQLERLLGGDRNASERLVQNLLDAYPDKSERWCYEKAVFDLTRDRH